MPVSTSLPASGGDIACYRGDTFELWVRIMRNGVEEDLSGDTFRMQLRSGNAIKKELSTGNGISLETPGGGVLAISITAAEMQELTPGTYQYDMQQTYQSTNKVKTRFRGTFTVTDDVTKPPYTP